MMIDLRTLGDEISEVDDFLEHFHSIHKRRISSLNDSKQMNLTLSLSESDLVDKIVLEVIDHLKIKHNRSRVSKSDISKVVSMVLANIKFNDCKYIAYDRDRLAYKKGYYNPSGIGYRGLFSALDCLEELGYIDENYIAERSSAKSRIKSRFKSSARLKSNLRKLSRSSFVLPTDLIEVKNDKKEKIELKNHNSKVDKVQKNLEIINSTNLSANYTYKGKDVSHPILKRVFNNGSLKYGGRFYCLGNFSYQQLNEVERTKIKINGSKTCELDYKSMHPTLLYSMLGLVLKDDPYFFESEFSRETLKTAFLMAINCKSLKGAYHAFFKERKVIKKEVTFETSKKIINTILNNHRLIESLFFKKNLAVSLQFTDSKIAEEVLLDFIKKTGSPILPIHDSFIVLQKHKTILKTTMHNVFFKHTNTHIEVH